MEGLLSIFSTIICQKKLFTIFPDISYYALIAIVSQSNWIKRSFSIAAIKQRFLFLWRTSRSQESTSDILVQNCDEYYSYTSLAGLRKTSDLGASAALDPWVLIDKAVKQMEKRRDVMRSDVFERLPPEVVKRLGVGGSRRGLGRHHDAWAEKPEQQRCRNVAVYRSPPEATEFCRSSGSRSGAVVSPLEMSMSRRER